MNKPHRHKRRSKPCTICRVWFTPNPRLGSRQVTCAKPACRKARKRKTQRAWAKANPDYLPARRLQQQLDQAAASDDGPSARPPPAHFGAIPADVVNASLGAETLVVMTFLLRLQHRAMNAAMRAELSKLQGKSVGHDPPRANAAIGTSGQGP